MVFCRASTRGQNVGAVFFACVQLDGHLAKDVLIHEAVDPDKVFHINMASEIDPGTAARCLHARDVFAADDGCLLHDFGCMCI